MLIQIKIKICNFQKKLNEMELINLLIKPGKHQICMLCFNECNDTFNIYIDKEIEENFLKVTLSVADMINYLFPSFEITLAQVCNMCSELLIKMYLLMKRNNHRKEILKIIINTLNKELNENDDLNLEDMKKGFLNINLSKILNTKEITKDKIFNEDIDYKSYENGPDNETEDDSQKQCPICFKIFNNIKLYKVHIKTHRRKRKLKYYYCNECNYKTPCKESVQGHKNKYHLNTRSYVCQTCYKSFYHKKNLIVHIKTHGQVLNEICEICGETFIYKKNLLEHLKLHSGERPYECEFCGKKFVTSGRRLEHIKRTHMEKNICCLFCDKKFSLNKELTRHMKNVHSSL